MNIYYKTYEFNAEEPITESERKKARSARDELLKRVLEENSGRSFDEIEIKKGEHGKPYADTDFYYNLSHTRGLVVIAISDNEVGIDCEYIRPANLRIMDKFFSPDEKNAVLSSDDPYNEIIKYWTLKESYIKLLGVGFSERVSEINFVICEDGISSNTGAHFMCFEINNCVVSVASENVFNAEFKM